MPSRRHQLRSSFGTMLLLLVVVGIAQLAGVAARDQRDAAPRSASVAQARTYLVHGTTSATASRSLARGGKLRSGDVKVIQAGGGWREVQLRSDQPAAEVEATLQAAGADAVEVVEPRFAYDVAMSSEPEPQVIDDPTTIHDGGGGDGLRSGPTTAQYYAQQWALSQSTDEDLDAPEAWSLGTGSADVIVAVIDTGVDATHPDLAGRLVAGRDFSGSATGPNVDRVGHGTMVASVIAGAGTGMAGVAPGVRVMPLKVFRDSAVGFSMSGYLQAIRYAADNGADVINVSLGCGGTSSCYSDAEFDALEYARSKGVLVVAAAGNGDSSGNGLDNDAQSTPDYPSGYDLDNIIAVTASTRFGNWSTWANYGRTTVDIAAPGEAVLVAKAGGGYGSVSGTSFSAPYTAGVAALVESRQPGISLGDLRARILGSAVAKQALGTRTVSGGVVNADAAVRSTAAGGGAASPASTFTLVGPPAGAVLSIQPTLSWRLPSGWRSARVRLRQGPRSYDAAVDGARRAFVPPASAWSSGTYTWSVVAIDAAGVVHTSPPRSWTLRARHASTLLGGTFSSGGRTMAGRVSYRTNSRTFAARVVVKRGTTVLYTGRMTSYTGHLSSSRSPRGASFGYTARLAQAVRSGQHLTAVITLTGGGTIRIDRWSLLVG